MISRRKEREYALQVLYAQEYNPLPLNDAITEFNDVFDATSGEFTSDLVNLCIQNREELDEMIKENLRSWKLERIAIVDKLIIRMGLVELLYFSDIPPEATLNEAVELSRKFGADKSVKFVNGVLDVLLKKLHKQGRISKSGRGLISKLIQK